MRSLKLELDCERQDALLRRYGRAAAKVVSELPMAYGLWGRERKGSAFSKVIQTGYFRDTFAYVRFGIGTEKIVIFPPLNDALFTTHEIAGCLYALFYPLAKNYEIYAVSRKRSLPVGCTTSEMAADYAGVFEDIGPAHVLGVSLGGMVAQVFAKDYPQYVKKLIILSSAHHMGPEGLDFARRWIPWAREGAWKKIYYDTLHLSYHTVFRWSSHVLAPYILGLCHKAQDASAFIIAGQAGMIHDASDFLAAIQPHALIIGGTRDPLFPESLFHEMQQRMPQARLLMIPGAKHGVFEENRRHCIDVIKDFLAA